MRASTRWWPQFALLWSGQFLATLGLMMLVPLMPFYVARLPGGNLYPDFWGGLALAAPGLTVLLTAPWWGGRCDRLPWRLTVSLAFGVFALSMALMAAGWSVESFLTARLLQGASGMTVVLTACVAARAPELTQGRALGTLQSAVAAACVVGPLLGGLLLDHGDPALLLWATAVGTALCALAARWLFDTGSAASAGVSTARLPLREFLAMPGLVSIVTAGALTQAAAFAALPAFAAMARVLMPQDAATFVGVAHSAGWCAALVAAPWWGRRNDRGGAHATLVVAAAGCALAIAIQPLVGDARELIALRLLQGFFLAGTAQTVFFLVYRRVEAQMRGRALGFANSALTGGQVLGPAAAAALLPMTGAAAALWFAAMLFLGAALIVVRARRVSPAPGLGAGTSNRHARRSLDSADLRAR